MRMAQVTSEIESPAGSKLPEEWRNVYEDGNISQSFFDIQVNHFVAWI
jgi:hypothetical protein